MGKSIFEECKEGIMFDLRVGGNAYIPNPFTNKDWNELDKAIKKEFGENTKYSEVEIEEIIANEFMYEDVQDIEEGAVWGKIYLLEN